MAATSVSGVSGPGSAGDGQSRGRPEYSLGVEKLIGPRVIMGGQVTLNDGGSGAVLFPVALSGVLTNFAVFLQGDSSTVAFPSSFVATGFSITGGVDDVVYWQVVRVAGN